MRMNNTTKNLALLAEIMKFRPKSKVLTRQFHELLSRDRGGGCATGQPQGGWTRGVLELYVAGSDTRGRPLGRSYPRSQQAIHEIAGLILQSKMKKPPPEGRWGPGHWVGYKEKQLSLPALYARTRTVPF